MLIDRIYLRNYRVFEDELDLDVPPGLVGVFGPNGAGKSTLLESVLWTLWGRTRTAKEDIRSAGSHGECVAEVAFEHEGHIYLVRRTISGANSLVRAQAQCDGQAVAEGVRETARYVHSVLGMDDAAFRASVFAEQKQIAAFSTQGPADRRKLVLSLLGVTPLDTARDQARADARQVSAQHDQLRRMLPDVGEAQVAAADATSKAEALEVSAVDEEKAAAAARLVLEGYQAAFARLDRVRQDYEKLLVEGRSARAELDNANQQVDSLRAELATLSGVAEKLAGLEQSAVLPTADTQARLLAALAEAADELGSHPDVPMPPVPDDASLAQAADAAMVTGSALGAAKAKKQAASAQLRRAQDALASSSALSQAQACPLCGQELGEAFAQVQAHRAHELAAAEVELAEADKDLAQAAADARAADEALTRRRQEMEAAQKSLAAWQRTASVRQAAAERLGRAQAALGRDEPQLATELGPAPTSAAVQAALGRAEEAVIAGRRASEERSRLGGLLERRPTAEAALGQAQARQSEAAEAVSALLAQVKQLGFDPAALEQAVLALKDAQAVAERAQSQATAARLAATRAQATAESEVKRLADAQRQHAQLAELQSEAVHMARASELLNGFRNAVVSSVGPRLAAQAADLFAELTDNEYDRLEVDADTYGLKICDAGISYDLQRFSGSEVDLANLAMRVAISEHVRLLSGGTVGLLVLDEVFGPLDEERRTRMLLALERLRARFRQILVVTHSTGIKEQLPSAIEVIKKPGRRATARVTGI